jgi:hypothetical protein
MGGDGVLDGYLWKVPGPGAVLALKWVEKELTYLLTE